MQVDDWEIDNIDGCGGDRFVGGKDERVGRN
jgi:hypothetical protein